MTEDDSRPARRPVGAGSGAMSDRMQALLSRAAEEQLTEQRQVSAVLTDLRSLVQGLGDQVRGTASSARLEALSADVASVVHELRLSTTRLGDRLDELGRRVDEQAVATAEVVRASSGDGVAVRVAALASDVAAQGEALERAGATLQVLSSLPDRVAGLARELSDTSERLTPLPEVRAGVAELVAGSAAVDALRADVAALAGRVDGLPSAADVARTQDALGAAVGERLVRLHAVAERPVVTPQRLDDALAAVLARLDEVGSPVTQRLATLDHRLGALEDRLTEVGQRLSTVGAAAAGVPGLTADVAQVAARVGELRPVRDDLAALRGEVGLLREDVALPQVMVALGSLREDVEDLAGHMADVDVPTADAVGAAVTASVTERLVGELGPRVADLVLTRVAATLVEQVSGSVTASVQTGLTERVRAANADSERRISAHVDEAVLALAEALLRRRRAGRAGAALSVAPADAGVVEGDSVAATPPGAELDPSVVVPHDDAPGAADVDVDASGGNGPVRWPRAGSPDGPAAERSAGGGEGRPSSHGAPGAVDQEHEEVHMAAEVAGGDNGGGGASRGSGGEQAPSTDADTAAQDPRGDSAPLVQGAPGAVSPVQPSTDGAGSADGAPRD